MFVFVWVELPQNIDANEVFKLALKNNVAFYQVSRFFLTVILKIHSD